MVKQQPATTKQFVCNQIYLLSSLFFLPFAQALLFFRSFVCLACIKFAVHIKPTGLPCVCIKFYDYYYCCCICLYSHIALVLEYALVICK